jgi:hypothetical protein
MAKRKRVLARNAIITYKFLNPARRGKCNFVPRRSRRPTPALLPVPLLSPQTML